ncbi:MAG: YesL family protein [Lachnospiraceae bacterium]
MDRLFDLDNGFFRFMGKVFDMIVLNILCLITCIPIVTIGPSITALYYVAMKLVRDEEGYVVRGYFKAFKENFKKAFIIELIVAVCAALLYVDITVTYQWMQQDTGFLIRLLFYALVGLTLLAVVSVVYVFPVLAKFENTVKKILINSIMMSVRHLSWSVLMVVVIIAAGVAVYIYPIAIFFVIGAAAAINSIILRKIFDNYIKIDSEGKVIEEENNIEETKDE